MTRLAIGSLRRHLGAQVGTFVAAFLAVALLAGGGLLTGRLVREDHLGPHRERPRQRDPPPLSSGQLRRAVVLPAGEADPAHDLSRPRPVRPHPGQPVYDPAHAGMFELFTGTGKAIREGHLSEVGDGVRALTGRAPIALRDMFRGDKGAWQK